MSFECDDPDNYMHGIGLDEDVRSWFSGKVPRTTVARHKISKALSAHY